ncbi:hypothetical protein PFISCL1PPCAC_1250, partial [Pristionchus fissidentatus]
TMAMGMSSSSMIVFIMNLIALIWPLCVFGLIFWSGVFLIIIFAIWPSTVIFLGIFGACAKNTCCLMAHNIMRIIESVFFIIFTISGFAAAVSPGYFKNQLRHQRPGMAEHEIAGSTKYLWPATI